MTFFWIAKAFTLIEIMVVISIITIITLWASRINFNTFNDRQRLEIFSNNIRTSFENIRNNALLWKWVWGDTLTPQNWKMTLSWTWITTFYDTTTYNEWNIIPANGYSIKNISCASLDGTPTNVNVNIVNITIHWQDLSLSGDCNETDKIVSFTTNYKQFTHTLTINSINGIIEIKK